MDTNRFYAPRWADSGRNLQTHRFPTTKPTERHPNNTDYVFTHRFPLTLMNMPRRIETNLLYSKTTLSCEHAYEM